jgi:hypothetical protein
VASGTRIPDAPCGFRAFHADAALRLNVFGEYTYTLETIIQAGRKNIPITSVPIRVNSSSRPSRLIRSIPQYVYRSVLSITRIFVLYKPLRFFFTIGAVLLAAGTALGVRFLYLHINGIGGGRVQSLLLATVLIVTAMIVFAAGIISDLIAANRVLLEDLRMRQLRADIGRGH